MGNRWTFHKTITSSINGVKSLIQISDKMKGLNRGLNHNKSGKTEGIQIDMAYDK